MRRERKYFIEVEGKGRVYVWAPRKLEAIPLFEAKGYNVTAVSIRLVKKK